jgi:hypothetical protein
MLLAARLTVLDTHGQGKTQAHRSDPHAVSVAAVWIGDRPIGHPPGVLARDEPQQQVPADDRAWDYEGTG